LDSWYDKIKRKALKLDRNEKFKSRLTPISVDHKIENKFYRVLFPHLVDTHNLIVKVLQYKNRDIGEDMDGKKHQIINVYQYAFRRLMIEQPTMFIEAERYLAIARFFRSMTLVLIGGSIIWLMLNPYKLFSLILLLTAGISLLIFFNRWRKANHVALKSIIVLEGINKRIGLRHFVNMANMAKCSKLGEIIPKTMEQRFKSLSLFEFQERFSNAADCLKYLADEKWGNGFVCRKCGHTHSCAGKATQSRQCTCCRYVESPTAQTLFHKVKFDLLKAFYIVYFVSTNKKGITSTELSRKLNLRQKTCWGFKRKVMKAMESSENHPIEGDVEVDETVFGGQEENTKGRKNINKKLVVLAIEKKNKGVSRLYARVIPNASAEQLGGFMKAHIDPKAKITTDKWTGYIPLKADFENLTRVASGKKGSNFPELHRVVMNLKSWLRGVHHHVNDLQDYLNEYCYRFNRSFMKENIFDNLMKRMIEAEPCYIKNISQ
jgi:hypothetical protein